MALTDFADSRNSQTSMVSESDTPPKEKPQDEVAEVKAHSHYCVFRVRLRQMVALLHRDRKIPISALTQSTAESADRCGECE